MCKTTTTSPADDEPTFCTACGVIAENPGTRFCTSCIADINAHYDEQMQYYEDYDFYDQ